MTQQTALTHSPRAQASPTRTWWRTLGILTGATMAAAAPITLIANLVHTQEWYTNVPVVLWLMAAAILVSGGVALSKRLSLQLLARSVWWQALLYSSISFLAMLHFPGEGFDGGWPLLLMIGGSVLALASAGRTGLHTDSGIFSPNGFRNLLMVSIVLAMADTQALLFYSGMHIEAGFHHAPMCAALTSAAGYLACAAVMIVSLVGLYRMKLWGLALTIVANVGIATLALTGVLGLPDLLANTLAATAALQLLIPMPLIKRMIDNARR